jgi:S-methylmethionine-dependent homocysteine/selenocysteine methylase
MRNVNQHHYCNPSEKSVKDKHYWREIDVISWLEEGEQIVDICCNVRLIHCSVCVVHNNADKV